MMMKNITITLFLLLVVFILDSCSSDLNRPNMDRFGEGRNFNESLEINEEIQSEIISFFESTNNLDEIIQYCEDNKMYCMYYCREINPEHNVCDEMGIPTLPGDIKEK